MFFASITSVLTLSLVLASPVLAVKPNAAALAEKRNAQPANGDALDYPIANRITDPFPWNEINDEADINEKRSKFTKETVERLQEMSRAFNYAIAHKIESTNFEGQKGTDWEEFYYELRAASDTVFGYNIYAFRGGQILLKEEAKSEDWDYRGKLNDSNADKTSFTFATPEKAIEHIPDVLETFNGAGSDRLHTSGVFLATMIATGLLMFSSI